MSNILFNEEIIIYIKYKLYSANRVSTNPTLQTILFDSNLVRLKNIPNFIVNALFIQESKMYKRNLYKGMLSAHQK